MIINILDKLIAQASEEGWVIKYVALDLNTMGELVREVTSFAGANFKIDTLVEYKDIPLKVKDIVGFQVAYQRYKEP